MRFEQRSVFATSLIFAAAAALALVLCARPLMVNLVTNADALLPADLIWTVLHHPQGWRNFEWPRIPSLFPDFVIFGALQSAFGWRVAQLGYSVISLVSLTALAGWIAQRLAPISFRAGASAFLAVAALVFLGESLVSSTAWHLHLLASAYHSGPFILSVAALCLAWRAGRVALGAMVLVAAVGTFSDRLFVGTFALPLAVTLTVMWWEDAIDRRTALRRAGLAVLGCLIGLAADKVIFPEYLTRQADVPFAPLLMITHAVGFLATRSAWFTLGLNAIVLWPLWRRRRPPSGRFWWLVAAAAMVPTTLLTAGLWEDEGGERYLSPVLWWPLILWAPFLALAVGRAAMAAALVVCGCVIGAFAWSARTQPVLPMLAWADPVAACLAPTGRIAGLAEYWEARPITVSSNWRMQVMQIGPRGNTRTWGNDPSGYTRSLDTPDQPPPFSFIVMKGLDAASILAHYGPADSVLNCAGSDVWLYNDPSQLRKGLAALSPSLVPRGQKICVGPDRLSRRGGALPAAPFSVTTDRQVSRPVTFGPNLDLHAGRWQVSLRYRLQTDTPGEDRWLVNGQWGTLHLTRTTLPPTGVDPGVTMTDIVLNREIEAVEVPTYLAGNATLQIIEACFEPLGG